MVGCCAGNCTNSSAKGFSMFRFPNDAERREKWTDVCDRPGWSPSNHTRLCDAHFDENQWEKYKVRLKPDAVPHRLCSCHNRIPNAHEMFGAIPPNVDHLYAAKPQHFRDCLKVSGRTVQPLPSPVDVVEHCVLQRKLQDLTARLAAKENEVKGQQALLSSVSSLKSASEENNQPQFDSGEIKSGLQLRFACGTSGYEAVLQSPALMKRQPSVRTLQRRTQHISFEPGLQLDIISALREKVKSLPDQRDRDCNLFFDAMATKARLDFDIGTKSFLGRSTLPGLENPDLACKGEVWMFGGVRQKWKQIVAWHLTPNQECAKVKKNVILDLLKKADEAGLHVVALVCDMGNRALLTELGFCTTKNTMRYCIPNPVKPTVPLYMIPDIVHVFKSLKEMIVSNEVITLPDSIVEEFDLPANEVCLSHIEFLEEYQRGEDLKFVPKLKVTDIHTPHYSKMKVKSSHQVLHHKTACSIEYLVQKKIVPESYRTTAWFVGLMDRWRQLMTSRTLSTALSKKNEEAYYKARAHLKLVIKIFKNMKVAGGWKPVQTHLVMATEAILEISEHLLEECGYDFLFVGRFLQDIVENLFSVIRMQRPTPGPVELKYRLKQCALSQFNKEIKNSSYDFADTDDFVDLLLVKMREEPVATKKPDLDLSCIFWSEQVPLNAFKVGQEDILYRMCGYAVVSLVQLHMLKCEGCVQKLSNTTLQPHSSSLLLKIMNYAEDAQFEVSDELFQMLRLVEFNLRKWKADLALSSDSLEVLITERIIPSLSQYRLSTCHDIKDKILKKFSFMRIKQLSQVISESLVRPNVITSQLSSKTAGSKFIADNFRIKSKKAVKSKKNVKSKKTVKSKENVKSKKADRLKEATKLKKDAKLKAVQSKKAVRV